MSKDGLLALKIQVYGALANLCAPGHVIDRGAVEAMLEKNLAGRPEDGLSPLFLFTFATLSGRHRGTLFANWQSLTDS